MRIESGRWYDKVTGKNVQQVPKAKRRKDDPDEFRKPTLRDAFTKEGECKLYPSATTIMSVKAKPGLLNWLISQAVVAAATCPRLAGESDVDWLKKVLADADEERDAAASTGKDFHSAADAFWAYGTMLHVDPAIATFLTALAQWREEREADGWGRWSSEQPYIDHCLQIAGTPDLVAHRADGAILVADYKTCDLVKLKGVAPAYDEHAMQIAIGANVLSGGIGRTVVGHELYVDRNTGVMLPHVWSEAEIVRGLAMFRACNDLWKLVNNWDERKAK